MALVADPDYARAAVPRLIAARESVPEPLGVRIDLALVSAYATLEDPDRLLPVARRIYDAYPDSPTAFTTYGNALAQTGGVEEARRMASARPEKLPNDPDALRLLFQAFTHGDDYPAAHRYLQQVVENAKPDAADYNVSLTGDWGDIHTLAAQYAEAGKSLEARTKLLEAMDTAGREEPSSVDWYVFGRIAENYGATDAALAVYKRVTVPKRLVASSTYALAQRGVKRLTGK